MPIYKQIIKPNYSIYIWKVTESLDELSHKLPVLICSHLLKTNKLSKRRVEKSVQIHLLQHAEIDPLLLSYAPSGKPFISNSSKHISFSHSGEYATLMVSKSICGIDIEYENPKIEKISPKFLNENEKHFLSRPGALNWIWSIKETVFKYFGERVLFKDDILIEQLDPELLSAQVRYKGFHGNAKFEINLDRFGNYYLAYIKAFHPL